MGRQVVHPALGQPQDPDRPMHDNGRYVKPGAGPRRRAWALELPAAGTKRFSTPPCRTCAIRASCIGCKRASWLAATTRRSHSSARRSPNGELVHPGNAPHPHARGSGPTTCAASPEVFRAPGGESLLYWSLEEQRG